LLIAILCTRDGVIWHRAFFIVLYHGAAKTITQQVLLRACRFTGWTHSVALPPPMLARIIPTFRALLAAFLAFEVSKYQQPKQNEKKDENTTNHRTPQSHYVSP
jgi:hypothetical protein